MWRDERGSQIVEFALVAPLLCFLVLSAPVLGMAVRAWFVVEAAAREGARVAAITGDVAQARQRACHAVTAVGQLRTEAGGTALFACDGAHVDVQFTTAGAEVTVVYHQPTIIPGLGALLGGESWSGPFRLVGRAIYLPEHGR